MYSIKNIGRSGPRVLLLHGLYSSAGAWIPTLKYFRKFQVTLITIDYHAAISEGLTSDLTARILLELPKNFDFALGHSFGCFFLRLLELRSTSNIYIAPPFIASGFAVDKYLDFIVSKVSLAPSEVSLVVKRAVEMNMGVELTRHGDDVIFLPSSDEFFSYSVDSYPVRHFPGTHSDIEAAVDLAFSENFISC